MNCQKCGMETKGRSLCRECREEIREAGDYEAIEGFPEMSSGNLTNSMLENASFNSIMDDYPDNTIDESLDFFQNY
jgi:hypothetical protein